MQKDNNITRNFGLSNIALNNRVSIFIITSMVILFGLVSYITVPKEQFPEIILPLVYVTTTYPGNSPADIESLITRPLEKELKSVKGVKNINSSSLPDASIIIVEFNEDVETQQASLDTKDAVDKAKKDLPNDLEKDPLVEALDLSEIPIVLIHLSGDFEIEQLKKYAEFLEDKIEALAEVAKVDIAGSVEKEIQINVDIYKMYATGLSFSDIESAISSENITLSAGDVQIGNIKRSLRVFGEFRDIEELKNIIVSAEEGNIIYLRDVAEVKDSYEERSDYSRLIEGSKLATKTSENVVSLIVKKKSGENLINASVKIDQLLNRVKTGILPKGLSIVLTEDQSVNVKRSIDNLENSIISGVILVVLILLFFMGLRNALLVGIAIPLSMFMSFMTIELLGYTMNIVILFGLILALGMLVDNGIVVVENIYRLRESGYDRLKAAKEGIGEVAVPIITSTATTLAAFLPLAFWGGLVGEFMKYLPITLIIVLASSLFVGIVINPVFSFVFMKVSEGSKQPNRKKYLIIAAVNLILAIVSLFAFSTYAFTNLFICLFVFFFLNATILRKVTYWFSVKPLVFVEKLYLKFLNYVLNKKRPYLTFVFTFLLLVLSLFIFANSDTNTVFFPENEPEYAYILIETPIGSDVDYTNQVTQEVENKLYDMLYPYQDIVKSVVINVGSNTVLPSESLNSQSSGKTSNKSKITITFVPFEERGEVLSSVVLKNIGNELKNIPGIKIVTDKQSDGPPVGKAINLEFTGEDYITLIEQTQKIKHLIDEANLPGIDGLTIELETGKPELLLKIDRAKIRQIEISTGQIASALRTALYGKEISKFKSGEDEYPIQLRFAEPYRYDVAQLLEQKITFRDKMNKIRQVPISSIASIEYTNTFGAIKRKDLKRLITLSSNVLKGYNANALIANIKQIIANNPLPPGYDVKFTGEQEEQAKTLAFLIKALAIAVSSIFLILVSQFNSIIKPFIIIGSVIFSLVGVLLGIVFFNMEFVIVMTGVGIISLAGVVVNNSIVLIDYIDLTRKRKQAELGLKSNERLPKHVFIECLIEGGSIRLRPVLLTAITTVLGLIPLATGLNIDFFGLFSNYNPHFFIGGDNANLWGPMAWTVIFGLVFATFLTLIVVPVMYFITDRISLKFTQIFG